MVAWLMRTLVFSSLRVVLDCPNLAMHSNWPLLHIHANGDAREIEGRRKSRRVEEQEQEQEEEALRNAVIKRQQGLRFFCLIHLENF